jgi:hypothetical protein
MDEDVREIERWLDDREGIVGTPYPQIRRVLNDRDRLIRLAAVAIAEAYSPYSSNDGTELIRIMLAPPDDADYPLSLAAVRDWLAQPEPAREGGEQ